MTFSVVQAKQSNAKNIHQIISSCVDWLHDNDMNHWSLCSLEEVKKRIAKKAMYLALDNDDIVGTVTITTSKPFYHSEEDDKYWTDPKQKAFYIKTLAILPEYMNKGYATKVMEFAENKAKQEDIKYIRFDAVSYFKKLIDFYTKREYKIVGTRLTGTHESHFFEKCL